MYEKSTTIIIRLWCITLYILHPRLLLYILYSMIQCEALWHQIIISSDVKNSDIDAEIFDLRFIMYLFQLCWSALINLIHNLWLMWSEFLLIACSIQNHCICSIFVIISLVLCATFTLESLYDCVSNKNSDVGSWLARG